MEDPRDVRVIVISLFAWLPLLILTVIAFAPLLAAHGALLAGLIANRIFFQGAAAPGSVVKRLAGLA